MIEIYFLYEKMVWMLGNQDEKERIRIYISANVSYIVADALEWSDIEDLNHQEAKHILL